MASIIITEPATADSVSLANYSETEPVETLYAVAGVMDYYGARTNGGIALEAAEASIDALLGVVTGLTQHCWREGDKQLTDAIELWLSARGRS
jgi:hypothetical protein